MAYRMGLLRQTKCAAGRPTKSRRTKSERTKSERTATWGSARKRRRSEGLKSRKRRPSSYSGSGGGVKRQARRLRRSTQARGSRGVRQRKPKQVKQLKPSSPLQQQRNHLIAPGLPAWPGTPQQAEACPPEQMLQPLVPPVQPIAAVADPEKLMQQVHPTHPLELSESVLPNLAAAALQHEGEGAGGDEWGAHSAAFIAEHSGFTSEHLANGAVEQVAPHSEAVEHVGAHPIEVSSSPVQVDAAGMPMVAEHTMQENKISDDITDTSVWGASVAHGASPESAASEPVVREHTAPEEDIPVITRLELDPAFLEVLLTSSPAALSSAKGMGRDEGVGTVLSKDEIDQLALQVSPPEVE
ncbi:splicing factor U2AF large subunit [Paenibacillus massiliensis]|uniref:hypothetical protein n=1 Tax=Paenibacillus massiliensis TaxID=225917 RepID=UPI0012EC4E3C|nr:hypothetical protein [Paenibacillus massiliensis]